MLRAVKKTLAVLALSFDRENTPKRPPVSYSPVKFFTSIWERATLSAEKRSRQKIQDRINAAMPNEPVPVQTLAQFTNNSAWYVKYPANLVSSTGINTAPLLGLAYETPAVVVRLLSCNSTAQMFCANHHYSVFTASIIAVGIVWIVGAISSITTIPIVSTLMSVLGFAGIVMFVAFDYAPACAPMVPTCFFSSMVNDIDVFLPSNIIIPQSLLTCKHDQTESVPDADCMVQCSAEPFRFTDFSANLAWIVCENSEKLSRVAEDYMASEATGIQPCLGWAWQSN